MHAVTVTVDIEADQLDNASMELQERVVPTVSQSPGFVAGYWLHPQTSGGGPLKGSSLILAESREAVDGMAAMARSAPTPPGVTITEVTVHEVIAHA